MPVQLVNGARLYYATYGQDQPGQVPIVLIHGAPSTGQADWAAVAPRLAAAPGGGYRHSVIVPDCRGHGQSENPAHSYSFSEMAADTAELIRALGYPRAHLIGHSNGGNVALVTLMEHPEVVATAVLQAANGYVSPDLLEREPRAFDPERVAREAPDWMNTLVAQHGPTHGPDYWRELLRLTLAAILTGPNYTPADLAQVRRPVLVVQGAADSVNAPGRHAQYLAEHIPGASLWLPEGAGHNVHMERTDEWLARVLAWVAQPLE